MTTDLHDRIATALTAMEPMLPKLSAYASGLSGKPVRVEAGPTTQTDGRTIWIRPPLALADAPEDVRPFCAPKGSICIDGTSLTVNEVDATGFSIGLVPHTRSVTTLGALAAGQRVNLGKRVCGQQPVEQRLLVRVEIDSPIPLKAPASRQIAGSGDRDRLVGLAAEQARRNGARKLRGIQRGDRNRDVRRTIE